MLQNVRAPGSPAVSQGGQRRLGGQLITPRVKKMTYSNSEKKPKTNYSLGASSCVTAGPSYAAVRTLTRE